MASEFFKSVLCARIFYVFFWESHWSSVPLLGFILYDEIWCENFSGVRFYEKTNTQVLFLRCLIMWNPSSNLWSQAVSFWYLLCMVESVDISLKCLKKLLSQLWGIFRYWWVFWNSNCQKPFHSASFFWFIKRKIQVLPK